MGRKTLSKDDFVKRVSLRAKRYKTTFEQGQLDEWIKQGLVEAGERRPNIGHHPTYIYGCRHYRRTLQLVRLYTAGIKDRHEILVQLFIREYGVKPYEVREALSVEYRKAREILNSSLRSIFADREGKIPPGRSRQLLRQIGPADERLKEAEFIAPDELLVSIVRVARNPDSPAIRQHSINEFPIEAQDLFGALNTLFSGMLTKDEKNESEIERLIMSSNENEYEVAKNIFAQMRAVSQLFPAGGKNGSAEELARQAIFDSFLGREFSAFLLVHALKIATYPSEPGK